MKHKILMAVTLIAFASCMKLKKKGDDQSSPNNQTDAQVQSEEINRNELSYTYIISQKQSDDKVQFLVPLTWPQNVVLVKTDQKEISESAIEFDADGTWSDLITSQNKVNYQFYSKVGGRKNLLDEVEVLPVIDMHLTADVNLVQEYDLNEKTKLIFFKNLDLEENTHLFLENYSGKITIQNLYSNRGFIQTFPQAQRAGNDTNGKSGGHIKVQILSGEGSLNVTMRGENGGHGSPAQAADISLKGQPGLRGQAAEFTSTTASAPDIGTWSQLYTCSKSPGSGKDGGVGQRGYTGHDGKSGGSSGTISINNLSSAKIEIFSIGGDKGVGSAGGNGGAGGDPGAGGDGNAEDLEIFLKNLGMQLHPGFPTYAQSAGAVLIRPCPAAASGSQGQQGPAGLDGINGQDGEKQKSCVKAADQSIKCNQD